MTHPNLIINTTLSETVSELASRVESLLSNHPTTRVLVALVDVPGSGKSTVSAALLEELSKRSVGGVIVVPMVRICPAMPEFLRRKLTNPLPTFRTASTTPNPHLLPFPTRTLRFAVAVHPLLSTLKLLYRSSTPLNPCL